MATVRGPACTPLAAGALDAAAHVPAPVSARSGRRSIVYGSRGPGGRRLAPVVRVQGVDAGFTERSYAPGEAAELELGTDARGVSLQGLRVLDDRARRRPGLQDERDGHDPVRPRRLDRYRDAPSRVGVVRAGPWPSGLYFLRAAATDGRVGYAPFILRPRRFGALKVAVVLSTNTWQAYNFHDDDGDGWGDSWYVSDSIHRVDLQRPYLDFGVPFRYRDWDLAFIAWLNRTGKQVEFLSDDDLERFRTGDELAAAYDLVVFPGHAEYVTSHAYDVVERYRDRGGNLMFLSANNFFWRVRREDMRSSKRRSGGTSAGPRRRSSASSTSRATAGSGRRPTPCRARPRRRGRSPTEALGRFFGSYGIEIDARSPASPPGTLVLAQALGAVSPVRAGEMTYYETPTGAKVFAAGTLNFAASIDEPAVARLLENVWARLSTP